MRIKLILSVLFIFISCSSNQKNELSKEDKKANIYYVQGTKELYAGQYRKALKNLRLSSQFKADDSKTQNNLGMAYYYRKSYSNAFKHLKLAIKYDSKNLDARLNLATIYMEQKKYKLALKNYKFILEDLEYGGQAKTNYNLGILYFKQAKYRDAIKYFNDSLTVSESYCPSHFKLGQIYKRQRQLEKALSHFIEAGKGLCYRSFDPFKEQILLHTQLNNPIKARQVFKDTQERFSGTKEQAELKKLTRYMKLKLE